MIDALQRDGCFAYIDRDHAAGRCPICEAALAVCFIGSEPAAEFVCDRGCDERRIVAKLGKARL